MNSSFSRIPSLDGFRAISISLVILSHLILRRFIPLPPGTLMDPAQTGILGVRIFFIISGFLITYLLLKEREATGDVSLKAFYIRRVLRIVPVFYGYLLVLVLLNKPFDLNITALDFAHTALFVQNFTLASASWFTGHSWSLGVEEQFYILWPILFLWIRKLHKVWVPVAVLTMGSFMRSFHYKYPDTAEYFFAEFLMHADFLFAGCYIAFLLFHERQKLSGFFNSISSLWVYAAILLVLFFSQIEFHPVYDKVFIPTSGTIINVCICLLLLYFILREKSIGYKFLNHPVIRYIGVLSYSLYLWQQFYICDLDYWVFDFPQNLLFIFLTAMSSHYLIEKPFLRIRDRFKQTATAKSAIKV
jgi:peptidoglycan/LPS O-acetylase OafA/YrhL